MSSEAWPKPCPFRRGCFDLGNIQIPIRRPHAFVRAISPERMAQQAGIKTRMNLNRKVSRRSVLQHLAAGACSLVFPRVWPGAGASPAPVFFEEIPAATSGIHWVHTAGKSRMKYLPESSGAGCAFLDYDNDGWMDIYLVISGKCDFYHPPKPLRNALYRNNRDGTFTDVTEKTGLAGDGYGMR